MFASRYADPQMFKVVEAPEQSPKPKTLEKPLPPPPVTESAAQEERKQSSASDRLSVAPTPSPTIRTTAIKKKVPWKGRNVVVAIPLDKDRGLPGGPPRPLSAREVEARFRAFEQSGSSGLDGSVAQNRQIYPDEVYMTESRPSKDFRVRIPNRKEWDAYVEYLREEKLRALGVVLGGKDESASMSRQSSNQTRSQTFSPLPRGLSVSSQPLATNGAAVGVPFMPSRQHSYTASIASPISSYGNPQRPSMHMHRHSTFSPFSFPQPAPTPPGVPGWSPQQFLNQHGARGGSPSVALTRADLAAILSPGSPFSLQNPQQYPFPQQQNDFQGLLHQQQHQRILLQQQQQQQQQQRILSPRPSSTLQEVPEVEEEVEQTPPRDVQQSGAPEIAIPTPRGHSHRHNISENLEREVDTADYHLEKSIDRQLDEDAEFEAKFGVHSPIRPVHHGVQSSLHTLWAQERPIEQVIHHPQPHSRTHSLAKQPFEAQSLEQPVPQGMDEEEDDLKTNPSDVDTNPSVSGMPSAHRINTSIHSFAPSNHISQQSSMDAGSHKPTHSSKPSMSKLNVAAKEFKFTPGASFNPSTFSFSGNTFQPAASKPLEPPAPRLDIPSMHSHNRSVGGSSFNVAAPSFTPSSFGSAPAFGTSTGFNFSAPVFNPEVASNQPLWSARDASSAQETPVVSSGPESIFGNVDFGDMSKPAARRSKAVPIVRPDSSHKGDKDDEPLQYDEEGRVKQADGRQKRARRGGDDGDRVPQFAVPSSPIVEKTLAQSLSREAEQAVEPSFDKENIAPVEEHALVSKSKTDVPSKELSHTAANVLRETQEIEAEVDGLEEGEIVEGAPSDQDGAFENTVKETQQVLDGTSHSGGNTSQDLTTRTHTAKSSLSAMAKPFVFNPGLDKDTHLGVHVTQPSGNVEEFDMPEPGATPLRSFNRSPATTYKHSDDGSYQTAYERRQNLPYPDSDNVDYDTLREPTLAEIDDVMKHLNEDDSELGIERGQPSWTRSSPQQQATGFERNDLRPPHFRSDAPSPSPRRLQPYLIAGRDSSSANQDPFSDTRAGLAYDSPVHRLNNAEDVPASDWDDMVSTDEEEKLQPRAAFFDTHVEDLVDGILQHRLQPLEQTLHAIQDSMTVNNNRGRRSRPSTSGAESDADDEDDEWDHDNRPPRSPIRDRRFEKIKNIVADALASYPAAAAVDLSEFLEALSDVKSTIIQQTQAAVDLEAIKTVVQQAQTPLDMEAVRQVVQQATSIPMPIAPQFDLEAIRTVVEESVNKRDLALVSLREQSQADDKDARIANLENMIRDSTARIDEEMAKRKDAENLALESKQKVRLADEELVLMRESLEDKGRQLLAVDGERRELRTRLAAAEEEKRALEKKNDDLTAQSAAFESTLDEYRTSSSKWRKDIDEAAAEKKELNATIAAMVLKMDDGSRIREEMRNRLEQLQVDMVKAAEQVASEKALWSRSIEKHRIRYEVLSAKYEAAIRDRERLEKDVDLLKAEENEATRFAIQLDEARAKIAHQQEEIKRLEVQEREGLKATIALEQSVSGNARLEEAISALDQKLIEAQSAATRFERESIEARESGRNEVERTRIVMQGEIEKAAHQVNVVRADLEAQLSRLNEQLGAVKADAQQATMKHELLLQQEVDGKKEALRDALEARTLALSEQQVRYERHIEGMEAQHRRALDNAFEDKQRSEAQLNERLSLSDAKVDHLQDKVLHLEEKFRVAKDAAQAAVQAAQSAKISQITTPRSQDKVSPQVFRESIVVLQDQLQEREQKIESLHLQLSEVDADAPAKLKEKDTEIQWLRELFGVRMDDLTELVNALSQPTFDQDAVRDAAIRLRANLQMEQHATEKQISGVQGFPTLASLSNFASPKAVQLAAAFGNWRKGSQSTSNLSTVANPASRAATPLKRTISPSTPGFLAGLMTPPASNLRRTPQPGDQVERKHGHSRVSSHASRAGVDRSFPTHVKQSIAQPRPTTPPLLRRASYDQDAEEDYSTNGFYDDEESTVDGNPLERGRDVFEPIA